MNNLYSTFKAAAAARRHHQQATHTINSTTEYIMELFLGFWDEVAGIFSGEGGGGEGDEGGANEIDEAIANVVKSNPFAPPRTSFRTHPTSPFANPSSSVSSSVSNYKSIQQEQQQQQQDEELDPDETPRPSTTGSSSSSFSSSSSSRPSTSSILTPYQQWKAAQRKHKGNYSEYTADLEKGKQKAEQQQHQNDDNDDAQQEEEEDEEETMEDKCARIFNVGDKDKFLKKYARSVNQNERTPLLGGADNDIQIAHQDSLARIQADLDDIRGTTSSSITKLLTRGEKMTDLKAKADRLRQSGVVFKKSMKKREREAWIKSMKESAILSTCSFGTTFVCATLIISLIVAIFRFLYYLGYNLRDPFSTSPPTSPNPGYPPAYPPSPSQPLPPPPAYPQPRPPGSPPPYGSPGGVPSGGYVYIPSPSQPPVVYIPKITPDYGRP